MALIRCRQCGRRIPEIQSICPYCTRPLHRRKRFYVLGIVLLLGAAWGSDLLFPNWFPHFVAEVKMLVASLR